MKIIRLDGIGKKFVITHQKDKMVKRFFAPGENTATEFWALKDVSVEIEQGKVIGVIGRNGAGKTTLLNILAGVSTPTEGRIDINGKVASLLTLGAGFQIELTGKENIYLNASIIGMSRSEINKKYKSIVDFSEIDGFLDAPLHSYSQGMRLRLGFSVAVHTDFNILLIDEIIAVGDVSFQKKCYEKIVDFKRQGKTMIITTQALDIIERICDEVILLENGKIESYGEPESVINLYLKLLSQKGLSEVQCLQMKK